MFKARKCVVKNVNAICKPNNSRRMDWRKYAFLYIVSKAELENCDYSNACGMHDNDGIHLWWDNRDALVRFAWKYKDEPDLKWKIYKEFVTE
jgi:hypothetical protein